MHSIRFPTLRFMCLRLHSKHGLPTNSLTYDLFEDRKYMRIWRLRWLPAVVAPTGKETLDELLVVLANASVEQRREFLRIPGLRERHEQAIALSIGDSDLYLEVFMSLSHRVTVNMTKKYYAEHMAHFAALSDDVEFFKRYVYPEQWNCLSGPILDGLPHIIVFMSELDERLVNDVQWANAARRAIANNDERSLWLIWSNMKITHISINPDSIMQDGVLDCLLGHDEYDMIRKCLNYALRCGGGYDAETVFGALIVLREHGVPLGEYAQKKYLFPEWVEYLENM